MKVSLIGTGRMGKGLIKIISPIISELSWASRNVEVVKEIILEDNLVNVFPVSYEEALNADLIIPALWYKDLIPLAKTNEEKLAGKILIDITNPFTEDFTDFTLEWGQSAAEELQKVIPNTKIVGAFKNTYFQVFNEPVFEGLTSDIYVTSDDEASKEIVMDFLKPIPFRLIDGGNLKNNRTIERMTLFEREIGLRYGNYPYISNRIFGINLPN